MKSNAKLIKKKKPKVIKPDTRFDDIIFDISENGTPTRRAIKSAKIGMAVFYELLRDEEKQKRYARACELRSDRIFEEMMDIADSTKDDVVYDENGNKVVNHNVINRDRLRVDTRKWVLSKMNPKKYGDKLELDANIEGNLLTHKIEVGVVNIALPLLHNESEIQDKKLTDGKEV
jgi:hypothetical protein